MKLYNGLLAVCALLLPCALSAESFEGNITMAITSNNGKQPQTMKMALKEGYLRIEVESEKGPGGTVITDLKHQTMLILMPQQQMYMERPIPTPGPNAQAADRPDVHIRMTGEHETIRGYDCEKLEVATDGKDTTDIWVTDQLGAFQMFHGIGGRTTQAPQAWEEALKGKNYFPLRVVSKYSDGKEHFRLDVVSIDKGSIPDSAFAAPDGWRKFDLGALMGGLPGAHP